MQAVGANHRQVIDRDVALFARLGLDALRLHVFDREVSERDGNLVDTCSTPMAVIPVGICSDIAFMKKNILA